MRTVGLEPAFPFENQIFGTTSAFATASLAFVACHEGPRERPGLFGRARREDGRAFLDRGREDRHQFRFIVSSEVGVELPDLRQVPAI